MNIRILAAVFFTFMIIIAALPRSARADGEVRLGVLEFENVTGDQTFKWVSRGIQESLSSKLAALPNIVVIERGQMNKILAEQRMQASGFVDTDTAVELGKIIGITKAVTGSYQISASRILISARVVDVESAEADAGIEVSGGVDDIFAHYAELAGGLSGSLGSGVSAEPIQIETLTVEAREEITRQDTTSFSAYEYYTKANEVAYGADSWITAMIDMIDQGSEIEESVEVYAETVRLLELAVEIDPYYARAWALLAITYGEIAEYSSSERAMSRARSIAPDDPFVLSTEGLFRYFVSEGGGNARAAISAFERVRRFAPGTYYAGLGCLFIVIINSEQDPEYFANYPHEAFELLTEARYNMPEAGFVKAFHGIVAIGKLFTDMETTFVGDDIPLSAVREAKYDLDIAIEDISDYRENYPNSMIAPDIDGFLPDALAMRGMLGALDVILTIEEITGGDYDLFFELAESDQDILRDNLDLSIDQMDSYLSSQPYGELSPILYTFLPDLYTIQQALGGEYDAPYDLHGPDDTPPSAAYTLEEGIILAAGYVENNDPYPAMDVLEELDALYPETYEVYYLFGLAYIMDGDYETAGDIMLTTIEIWPDVPEPYYFVGLILDTMDDLEIAYEYYLIYLDMAPYGDFADAAYDRAVYIESLYS